jgi:hypothetical protein
MRSFDLRSIRRQKIAAGSGLAAVALGAAQVWPFGGLSLVPLLVFTYIWVVWALDLDLKKEEWLVVPLFALNVTALSFIAGWWFVDTLWLIITVSVAFGVTMYGLLLTLNVLNVATVRPLPLVRQALSVQSMVALIGLFASFYFLLMILPSLGEWVVGAAAISFLFVWPLVWSARLGQGTQPTADSLRWSIGISAITAQLAAVVGLWPFSFMSGLYMAVAVSLMAGLVHYQQNRMVTKSVQTQYLLIGIALTIMYYVISQW